MTLPAWRPLKDAPKTHVPVVVTGRGVPNVAIAFYDTMGWHLRGKWEQQLSEEGSDVIYAPIADTLELDRAVQSEIARAFGALIQAMVDAEYYLSLRGPNSSYDLIYADNADGTFRAGTRAFRGILHTAMGGRIPDEVPHD